MEESVRPRMSWQAFFGFVSGLLALLAVGTAAFLIWLGDHAWEVLR